MRIAFFVNSIETEYPLYTTTLLALTALGRGHEICYVTPDDFVCRSDDSLAVHTRRPAKAKYKKVETFLKALQAEDATVETMDFADIDVMMLRNDPSLDMEERPWAAQSGILFGSLAAQRGTIVLNDPGALGNAQNKLYFQTFPKAVRPTTLISKHPEEIRKFIEQLPDKVVLKPLQGSGGKNVFLIHSGKDENLNQIIETVAEEGYIIAQGFMSEAKAGDIRLFVMNGRPLMRDGKYAAIRRVPAENEIRSNMHAKGHAEKVEVTDVHLRVAELVRPKLVQDGMFLVGLDIVGDKLLEINVFSPGALFSASRSQGVPFAEEIIGAIELKVAIRDAHDGSFTNRELATF